MFKKIISLLLLFFGVLLFSKNTVHQDFNSVENIFTEISCENLTENKLNTKNKLKIVSWNIQHLGRSKSDETIYQIASILRNYDIVAIQEVVAKDPAGAQAVAKIADELNRMGFKWDYQISDPTRSPSPNMSERYAFLWKTSKVEIQHRAFLDKELEEICFREPFIAKFKIKGDNKPFYVVNYHSRKYSDKPEEEIIHFIDYPKRLKTNRIMIVGDFNVNENHAVWRPLKHVGFQNALYNKPTTLKRKCDQGNYLNHAIDNLYFLPGISMILADSIDFVYSCENLEQARKISDHLPVFMKFSIL